MQASTRRLLSTLFIAIVGAAASIGGVAHVPAEAQAPVACALLAQIALAPR